MRFKEFFEFKKVLFFLSLLVESALLYFNLLSWHKAWLGMILFIIYFAIAGRWWQKIFKFVFGMSQHDIITRLFSWLAIFILLSLNASVWVVWYKITPFIAWSVYISTALLSALVSFLADKNKRGFHNNQNLWPVKISLPKELFFRKNIFFSLIFFGLYFLAGFFLLQSKSAFVLESPWQTINQYYLPIFFLLTFFLALIVFSQYRVKFILALIVLHSILLHLYLPVTHVLPWGGDVWRHIGIEEKLSRGEAHLPVLAGSEAQWREFMGVDLPEALLIPNKYLYGQLWGGTVLLSYTLPTNLLVLNKWLLPVLWSIMLPLIFFRIGRILLGSWRSGLVLAFAPIAAFPFHALGALTLPVSLGYLTFFFALMLWLQYLRDEYNKQRAIVLLFGFLMAFGYTLQFIFLWLIIFLSWKYKFVSRFSFNFKKISLFLLVAVNILFFPLFEILTKTSHLPNMVDWFAQFKQLLGQFSGWYFANAIRPHDILSGNILFNHTPDWAYVENLFTVWRWHVMAVMMFVWTLVFCALFFCKKIKGKISAAILKLFFTVIAGGYVVGWFVLEGDRSFIRRFDLMFAFLMLVFVLFGFYALTKKISFSFFGKPVLVFLCLVFAWFSSTAYASGPDMRVVSQNEYDAAKYVLENEDLTGEKHCVLADTWILLILEGMSGQKIVGGGFPINYQFSQPERVALYTEIQYGIDENILTRMRGLTGSDKCWLILPKNSLTAENNQFLRKIMKSNGQTVGDFVVWQEDFFENTEIDVEG